MLNAINLSIPKPAHPSPDRQRSNWLNLNGEWDFSFGEPTFERRITVPFSWASPLSGIAEDRKGSAFYRKMTAFDPGNSRLFLIFGAVDYACEVFVNGNSVGSHLGGYARFEFDVTSCWLNNDENTIVVKATDLDLPYQTYGKQGYGNIRGIWQTVYLEARPSLYLDRFVIRTLIDGTVTIDCEVAGEGDLLDVEACFGDCRAKSADGHIILIIDKPRLWTPDTPELYEGTLTVHGRKDGQAFTDCVQTYFGIREVGAARFAADGQMTITLNHQPLYIHGTLDQSFNPQGFFTLPTDEEAAEEIRRMKRLGLNLARIHIKPEEPLKLYYADKLGLLIMADLPCFWGEPTEAARSLFEAQMAESFARDINHPAIIYWVIFNETWGLLSKVTKEDGTIEKVYTPETQEWVRKCYRQAKQLDPTRLVEDNSPCRQDHVETDVNSWHFYANGYQQVRQVIGDFADGAYAGSTANFIGGNTCADIPAINSECGNVWGIKGNAGDSDISWHYKYMLNEFRLHDRISGFIFTEFHDVVNEFNGYYRIDNSEKRFGYEDIVPGMSIADLHAPDFLACDFPPMATVAPGETLAVPLFISSYTGANHNQAMLVRWELVLLDRSGIETVCKQGELTIAYNRFGLTKLPNIPIEMPNQDGIATLRLFLAQKDSPNIMRNFVMFDVQSGQDRQQDAVLSIEPDALTCDGFQRAWLVQGGRKLNGLGSGSARLTVKKPAIPGWQDGSAIDLFFEASSREKMTRDQPDQANEIQPADANYMLGYRIDRGANPNSFYMTDETTLASTLSVYAEAFKLGEFLLPDCPADSRGCLSWHYQAADDLLDEAGSYGYLCHLTIPADVCRQLPAEFGLTFRTEQGVSLFGRQSGRYPVAIDLSAVK